LKNKSPFELQVGDRFQFSDLGRQRNPRLRDRVGSVLAVGGKIRSTDSVLVLLDDSVTPIRLHRSYIEPIARNESDV